MSSVPNWEARYGGGQTYGSNTTVIEGTSEGGHLPGTENASYNVVNNDSLAGAGADRFTIAIVCALKSEVEAVMSVLDSRAAVMPHEGADYAYLSADFAGHRALLVWPVRYGQLDAALAVQHLQQRFGKMELTLLVGVCSGVAQPLGGSDKDPEPIFLGDVIFSDSITKYTCGARWDPEGVNLRNIVPKDAGDKMTQLLNILQLDDYLDLVTKESTTLLNEIISKKDKYSCPGESEDVVFESTYHHIHRACCPESYCNPSVPKICDTAKRTTCAKLGCEPRYARYRPTYASVPRRIHIGRYASEDIVMQNPEIRDNLAKDYKVLAFETAAAGVWQLNTTTLVIKAVCDYGDNHKYTQWQYFAAACAAATAKIFVTHLYPRGNSAA
ncbi:nucleoside phosphorylase domain-containing protein [Tricladium varicosporioides]|nr:nucleoside phosphorylase domain-containing protein [Hymenoscyphus varicosporioides]